MYRSRWLARHRLQDDRLEVAWGSSGRLTGVSARPPLEIRSISLSRSDSIECRAEGEHLVQGRAQRVDVASRVGHAVEPLGGHVSQGADNVAGLSQPFPLAVLGLRQPEVGDPDDSAGVEQEIRRFDVAVADALRVGVGQCVGRLGADPRDGSKVRGAGL